MLVATQGGPAVDPQDFRRLRLLFSPQRVRDWHSLNQALGVIDIWIPKNLVFIPLLNDLSETHHSDTVTEEVHYR